MKKLISVILLITVLGIHIHGQKFKLMAQVENAPIVFDAPIARASVVSVKPKFAQIDFEAQTIEVFYTVPELQTGFISSHVIVTPEILSNTPAWFARFTNFTAEVAVGLKTAAATNGLSLK